QLPGGAHLRAGDSQTGGEISQRSGHYQESVLSYPPAYVRDLQGREGGIGVSVAAVVGTREFEHHADICASWQAERQKDHAGHKFRRYRLNRGYRYRLTTPPEALLNARLDNIAIVPASMLPLPQTLKEQVNTLPKGGVFLCYAPENSRQKKILERVEETFREHGHAVKSMSIGEVYTHTAKSGY